MESGRVSLSNSKVSRRLSDEAKRERSIFEAFSGRLLASALGMNRVVLFLNIVWLGEGLPIIFSSGTTISLAAGEAM